MPDVPTTDDTCPGCACPWPPLGTHAPGCPVLADQLAAAVAEQRANATARLSGTIDWLPPGPVTPPPPAPAVPSDLYPIPDAAQLAGVCQGTIYSWHARGLVPFYGFQGAFRVSLSSLFPPNQRPATPARARRAGLPRRAIVVHSARSKRRLGTPTRSRKRAA